MLQHDDLELLQWEQEQPESALEASALSQHMRANHSAAVN